MSYLGLITSAIDWKSRAVQSRSMSEDDDRWYSPFISSTAAGIHVNPENAVGTAAVYAGVSAISQTIGSLPLVTYIRQSNGGRARAISNSFYSLLSVQVNEWMTSGEMVEMWLVHLLLRGNAYNFKLRDRSGRVVGLIPLDPCRMEVQQLDDLSLNYKYSLKNGSTRNLSQREILHFRMGFSDGVVGRSPITVARETVALTIATERYAGKFFKNSAKPSGILTHPNKLDKPTSDRIRDSWQKANAGDENSWKVAVLEEGMRFEPITMNARDSQFVEQRRYQLEDVARLFRVPPHIMGDLSRATFSNIEHQSINFVVYCLMPYMKRLEQTLQMHFFATPIGGKEYYAEFLVDGLLRGDTKTRQESFEIMRRNGVLSANEWRRLENLSPTEDGVGDKYLVPLNMTWAELLGKDLEEEPDPLDEDTEAENGGEAVLEAKPTENARGWNLSAEARAIATKMFAEILERLIYKETEALERYAKKDNADEKIAEFLQKHESITRAALDTPIKFYSSTVAAIRNQNEVDASEVLWNDFWEAYRAGIGQRQAVRSMSLSEKLRSNIDLIYDRAQKNEGAI